MGKSRFRVGVDTGGTFTDLVVLGDDGDLYRAKVLSTPDDFSRGILNALREVCERHGIAPAELSGFVHGTTVATNAILEGNGARIGLLTTRGFRDVLEVGRCRWDGNIFDPSWRKAPCLVPRHLRREIPERVSAQGEVIEALDVEAAGAEIRRLQHAGVDAIAVCLVNSYANPAHEQSIRDIAATEAPGLTVCLSSDVLNEVREFERTSTTAINACLVPVIDGYLTRLQRALSEVDYHRDVLVMQSNGGVMGAVAARRRPVHIVESGPAAGVRACVRLAQESGEANVIAFDMGGTTAKAALVENGRWFESLEYYVGGGMNKAGGETSGGHVLRVPSIEIAEVGSGGGSIAWIDDGGLLKVGPRSAGASPGPACYDLGGTEPTVTDAYAVLGYLNPGSIAGGAKSIVVAKAHAAIKARIADPLGLTVEAAAHAIYTIATSSIIRAVRAVTVERGRDARNFALVAFGGAGPMHAAELARAMGLRSVIIPACPGLFSAVGLMCADIEQDYSRSVLSAVAALDEAQIGRLNAEWAQLEALACADIRAQGSDGEISTMRTATMSYLGQSHELVVEAPGSTLAYADVTRLAQRFCDEHMRAYGYNDDVARVQIVSLRARASSPTAKPAFVEIATRTHDDAPATPRHRRAYFGPAHGWLDAPILGRAALRAGACAGPAIIEEFDTTILVPPRAAVTLDSHGSVVMRLEGDAAAESPSALSAISLELFNNALNSITDEMAMTLSRTARSLGVKDARDFSIAICTPNGEPVSAGVGLAIHLGAIPAALAAVRTHFKGDFDAGDVVFMNDPYSGGMHLPDIFVIKPLILEGTLLGYAAVVAHMADIGGRVPGGNAADSTSIYQEGLRLPPFKLYRRGHLEDDWISLIRANVRQPDTVVGDILAEVAACTTAEREFFALARHLGAEALLAHMDELINYGERMARSALARCTPGSWSFTDYLDDDGLGSEPVRVEAKIEVLPDRIRVDLSGTSPQVRGAINAPLSVTQSTIAFVVKTLLTSDVPNNAGFGRIIELKVPEGTIANMSFPAACAARAVTAYRILDALYGALAQAMPERVPAAGDGGPAILSVGGDDENGLPFVLMEVVSGAFGARPTADGLEGVASPFANTQNTSIEMIEAAMPLRVEHYGLVNDTGGAGRFRGGMALRRDLRFLGHRATLQIRSDRARLQPWGLAGGQPGSRSENWLHAADGSRRRLPGKIVVEIQQGDKWTHQTASGAGWGDPATREPAAVMQDVVEEKISAAWARAHYPQVAAALSAHLAESQDEVPA